MIRLCSLYQKAIQEQPQNADYPFALGTLYQDKGDFDSAITWYNKAQTLEPNNKEIQKVLNSAMDAKAGPIFDQAAAKQTAGDNAASIELYKQGLALAPKNARVWTNLGIAYQQTDQYQQARDSYQKAYDLDNKGEVSNLDFIAALDENANQGGKALSEYQNYIKLAPTGQYAGAAKERIKALSANVMNVQKMQTQAQQQTSRAAGDAYDAGVKLQQAGKFDDAIASYQKAQQANPTESAYPYALGTAYQQKADWDNAIIWYQKAVDLAPTNKDYKKVLADAKDAQAGPIVNQAIAKQQGRRLCWRYSLISKGISWHCQQCPLMDESGQCLSAGRAV